MHLHTVRHLHAGATFMQLMRHLRKPVVVVSLNRTTRTSSAAAVAGLLGGRDPATVQRIAMSQFRGIALELVTEADMMGNKPDPSLYVKTFAATFNSVDAFVSHSWSDDPRTKWTQLQRWRAQFKSENKREPIVWIDKFW